uniref:Tf2-1-like SH3-like domain-containing protein n=1 Tax=Cajanus cajan TaxID=3821 RepID=A0A151U2W2_CAJCA|nr:hypothetical protein KK1_006211 [Cajanus cajan]
MLRFIGHFQILKRVGSVAYQVALPESATWELEEKMKESYSNLSIQVIQK